MFESDLKQLDVRTLAQLANVNVKGIAKKRINKDELISIILGDYGQFA